jgi:hypothetical protein
MLSTTPCFTQSGSKNYKEPMLRKLILLSSSLLLAIPASAGLLSFTLDQSTISTPPGGIFDPACQNFSTLDCVIFSGTLSFTTDQDYFVNDIQIVMNPANPDGGADVTGNDNYFQNTVPETIGPDGFTGGIYTGGLFEIDVDPNTPTGFYNGTATLVATDSIGDPITGPDTVLNFQVDVIPEPGMGVLMFAGLASLAAMGLRVRQASRPVVLTDVPAYSGKQTGFRKTQNHPVTVLIYDEP